MQSAKSVQQYGLDKFGIAVVKPSTSFASKVQRFQDKNLIEKTRLPGPGSYDGASKTETQWTKKQQHQMKQPDWQQVPWNKQINPPSIPSHNFVFGYEEENGELVRQKNSEKVHTGVKSDTVGPGEYDIARSLGHSRKGVRWQPPKNNKKPTIASMGTRNSTAAVESSTVETPGPGHYLAENKEVVPIYKYK